MERHASLDLRIPRGRNAARISDSRADFARRGAGTPGERAAAEEVIELGTQLADALDLMHASGVLHRDIKPSNIGYSSDGTPKILDFGLAAILEGSRK